MGLLRRRRPLLRAAAVGGGAYAMGKRRERHQEADADAQYSQGVQDGGGQQPASGLNQDDTSRLGELGKLHDQGVLTDAEFSEQKAKILGS